MIKAFELRVGDVLLLPFEKSAVVVGVNVGTMYVHLDLMAQDGRLPKTRMMLNEEVMIAS